MRALKVAAEKEATRLENLRYDAVTAAEKQEAEAATQIANLLAAQQASSKSQQE